MLNGLESGSMLEAMGVFILLSHFFLPQPEEFAPPPIYNG